LKPIRSRPRLPGGSHQDSQQEVTFSGARTTGPPHLIDTADGILYGAC